MTNNNNVVIFFRHSSCACLFSCLDGWLLAVLFMKGLVGCLVDCFVGCIGIGFVLLGEREMAE